MSFLNFDFRFFVIYILISNHKYQITRTFVRCSTYLNLNLVNVFNYFTYHSLMKTTNPKQMLYHLHKDVDKSRIWTEYRYN